MDELKLLLERAHTVIWLNAIEPIDEKEKLSQEVVALLLDKIEKALGGVK